MKEQNSTFNRFQTTKILPNLDGLRGISIALVMLHHLPIIANPIMHTLQVNGRLGVMLFFVISGFLITHLALQERKRTGFFDLTDFYIRRGLRIFPLYYAVLLLVCVLVYGLNVYPAAVKEAFSEKLLSYIFYYSNLTGPISGPYSLLWSLAVEEQFYLFFSLIFYFFSTPSTQALFFILTILRLLMPFWGPLFDDNHLVLIAFRYQEAIFLGVSLAYLFEHEWWVEKFSTFLSNRYGLTALSLTLIFCLSYVSEDQVGWMGPVVNVCFALLVGATILLPPIPVLGGPLLSHIGKISYGIYLFHTLAFYGVKKYISQDPGIVFLLGAPATIAMASISYRYFESFFLKLKKKFNPC